MSVLKYKYWIYYVNPELLDELACMINEENCIYAYTDDKTIADQFEEIHDMSKFIKKKVHLTKMEVHVLTQDERNQYLKLRQVLTKDESGKPTYITLAITLQEEKLLDLQIMSSLNNLIYRVCIDTFPIGIFKDTIIKDLNKVKYYSVVNNYATGKNILEISNSCLNIIEEEKESKIYADEISVYTNLFHQILNTT